MLLDTRQTDVIGSGDIDTEEFRILASAKTFMVLSSSLYKYKIRAIIREVCCNAVDGHNAAKRNGMNPPKQFDVHLPTNMDPEFRCRDYGIGLSHSDVMTMYSTYFASTKAGSNDDIGGFGLGCKSPFCYSDTFSVISWFGGYKRVYTAYMHDGKPKISLLTEDVSDEPTGVEVSIPTEGNDHHEWYSEANYVFCTFDIDGYIPNMIGYNLYIRFVVDYDASGVASCQSTPHRNGVYAVMGGVAYPIPEEFIKNTFLDVYGGTNFIKFGVGELDMQPSREELSLDTGTKESLTNRIKGICDQIMVDINAVADTCTDIRDLKERMSQYPSLVWDRMMDNRMIDGKTVKEWKIILNDFSDHMPHPEADMAYVCKSGENLRRGPINHRKSDGSGARIRNIANFDRRFPYVILNDMKTGYGDVLRGLNALGYIRLNSNVYVANIADTNEFKNGITVGEANKKNIEYFMSLWPQRMKSGRVFLMSKWKDRVKAECAAKGIVIQSEKDRRKVGTPVYVDKIWYDSTEGGVRSASTKMFASEIAELTDGSWIVSGHRGTYYPSDEVYETATKKNGDEYQKFSAMARKHQGYICSIELITSFVELTKKTVYVCRIAQSRSFVKNPNLVCLYDDILKTAEDTISGMTVDDMPAPNPPRFINRLSSNEITIPLWKNLVSGNVGAHDKTSFLRSFVLNYKSDYRDQSCVDRIRNVESIYTKLSDAASDVAGQRINDFANKNPLIYKLLDSVYSISDAVAKDLVQLVRV